MHGMLEKSPLHSRAWIVQRSLLSPRLSEFSQKGIPWECREVSEAIGRDLKDLNSRYHNARNAWDYIFETQIQGHLEDVRMLYGMNEG